MPRLACIVVPLFPLAARLRSEPDLKGEAVVIVEGNGNAARVIAAARKARRAGIEPGMTLPQSRALLPRIVARPRDRESERASQEALLETADTFSPRVEDGGEGVVYLDIEGIPALMRRPAAEPVPTVPSVDVGAGLVRSPSAGHPEESTTRDPELLRQECRSFSRGLPSPGSLAVARDDRSGRDDDSSRNGGARSDPERVLGQDLIAAVEKAGLPARAGIASSKLAARVAAGLPESPWVVPDGDEPRFLAPLPLSRLSPAIEISDTLERWGIRSIGDFAKLPAGEVESRLGELGRRFHSSARGVDPRPLEARLPPLSLSEGMELEWPLVTLEPFLFIGHAALERLVRRLDSQGLACRRLELMLKLDPDGCDARAIDLPAPTREVKTLLTLVRLELEARPPGAPVVGFAFAAHPDKPRRAQLSLFGPPALSPDRIATTIARLASMLGADRVVSPRTVDGHRPERFAATSFEPPPPPEIPRPPRAGRGLLAVRVLRPPIEIEVITAGTPPGAVGLTPAGRLSAGHPEESATRDPELVRRECHSLSQSLPSSGSLAVARDDPQSGGREGRPYEDGGDSSRLPPSPPSAGERVGERGSSGGEENGGYSSRLPPSPLPSDLGAGLAPARRLSAGHPEESATRDPELASRECHSPAQSLPSSGLQVELNKSPGAEVRAPSSKTSSGRPADGSARDDPHPGSRDSRSPLRLLSIKSAPGATPAIAGSVRVAAGPWSMEEGWWSDEPASRDYWDVELSGGGLYRIYRDRASNSWFADGVYD